MPCLMACLVSGRIMNRRHKCGSNGNLIGKEHPDTFMLRQKCTVFSLSNNPEMSVYFRPNLDFSCIHSSSLFNVEDWHCNIENTGRFRFCSVVPNLHRFLRIVVMQSADLKHRTPSLWAIERIYRNRKRPFSDMELRKAPTPRTGMRNSEAISIFDLLSLEIFCHCSHIRSP